MKKFNIPSTPDKRLSQADVIGKVSESKHKVETVSKRKKKPKKPKTKRDKQVSLLLTEEEYLFVSELSEEQELSMTKIVRKFLLDKGFFND